MKTSITAQGRVLEVKVEYNYQRSYGQVNQSGVPRGTIRGLSRASRLRLLKELNRIHWACKNNKFITLTYPADYPETAASKDHLRAYLERMRRAHPKAAGVWRLEFQHRGAPHFHIVSPNHPYQNKRSIQKAWGQIIGYDRPFTRIDAFPGDEMVRYVAKYMGKVEKREKDGAACGYAPTIKPVEEDQAWTGRCWGVHNRPAMPYHSRYHTEVDSHEVYQELRDAASKEWPTLQEISSNSFTLFTDNVPKFLDLLK